MTTTLKKKRKTPAAPVRRRSARMNVEERRDLILEGAIEFFAERGFSGTIRDLSAHMQISPPLIFKYFDNKEELINEAFQTLFVRQVNRGEAHVLSDRSVSLERRLRQFYTSYIGLGDDPRWIRITLFAGLAGDSMLSEYYRDVILPALRTIACEINFALTGDEIEQPSVEEIESAWSLHAGLIYYLIRKHALGVGGPIDTVENMNRIIRHFLNGFTPSLVDKTL